MSSRPATCVVFDLDDTLFLERDYVRSGFEAVGLAVQRHQHVSGFADLAWSRFEQGQRGDIFDVALDELGIVATPGLIRELVTVYRTHEPAIEMMADARRAVAELRSRATLAVVSDGPIDSQRAKARVLGIEEWARVAVLTGEWGPEYSKPHPRAFEHVEHVIGVTGPACAYIADNPAKDFAAPRALGWKTVRVRRARSLHEAIASGGDVDAEVSDVEGAVEVLTNGSSPPS